MKYKNFFVWWICFIVLSLPTYQIRLDIGIPTTLLEMNIYLFVAGYFILNRAGIKEDWRVVKSVFATWGWPLLLLAASIVVSVIVSDEKRAALGLVKAYFIDAGLVGTMTVVLVRERKDYARIMGAMGLLVILMGMWALLQYVGLVGGLAPWINEMPKRVTGFYNYPNALGLFVAPVAVMFIGLILSSELEKKEKVFAGLVIAFGVTAAFLAVSRGALLGILAGLVVIGLMSIYRKWVAVALVVLGLIIVFWNPYDKGFKGVLNKTDLSTNSRIVLWRASERMISDRFWQGAGLANFGPLFESKYKPVNYKEQSIYPHNIILNFWTEMGLLGLAAFVWIIIKFFVTARHTWKSVGGYNLALTMGLIGAMVAIVGHGLVDVPYFKNDLAIEFWLIVSLMLGGHNES